MTGDPDFYVGYLPESSARLSRFTIRVVAAIGVLCVVVAVSLVLSQAPFAASAFEYRQYREYEGTLESWPYPMLSTRGAQFLLVGPGKHGMAAGDLDGK